MAVLAVVYLTGAFLEFVLESAEERMDDFECIKCAIKLGLGTILLIGP